MRVVVTAFLLLIVALATPAPADPRPPSATSVLLQAKDVTSPRDTLQAFLSGAEEAIVIWRASDEAGLDPSAMEAYGRAVRTMDFSATAGGGTWEVRTLRMLMLKDLLDRIPLPAMAEIPGDEEVRRDGIARWSVPGTSIVLARIDHGPRTGDFVFTADTVRSLSRLHRAARDVAFPAGGISLVDEFLARPSGPMRAAAAVRNRLQPVDTLDPRATLNGFLSSVNEAYGIVMETQAALEATPPRVTIEEGRAHEQRAANALRRAMSTLDLHEVPPALREDVGIETVLLLKEVIDRTQLPPFDAVPDTAAIEAERARPGSSLAAGKPFVWRYPNTEIEILEVTDGEGMGRFLFSAATVAAADRLYHRVRDLPYRTLDYGAGDYDSVARSEGFFEFYVSTPGYLIPATTALGRFVEGLPAWAKTVHGEQTVWQWLALGFAVVLVGVVGAATFWIVALCTPRGGGAVAGWLQVAAPLVVGLVVLSILDVVDNDLNLTGRALAWTANAGGTLFLLLMALATFNAFKALAETVIALPRVNPSGLDASLLRLGSRVVGFLVGVYIVVAGIRSLGIDIVPLIAGLGVGGLAVALAAQRTFANFIGSLMLYVNRPVRVGDLCRYGDEIGTVEEIGLISTRIRSRERSVVSVPNSDFSERQLENFSLKDEWLFKVSLRLLPATTAAQMRRILDDLRALLDRHPAVASEPARVRFVGFGEISKDVEIFAYLHTHDEERFLELQEALLLAIEEIVSDAGSGFAFAEH